MKIDALRNLPGVVASALISPDGLPLDAYGEGADVLAAELASLSASLDRTSMVTFDPSRANSWACSSAT